MRPSSLRWGIGLAALSSIIPSSIATANHNYHLQQAWEGEKILEHFTFFDGGDPTNGFVTYVNQSHALESGLVKITSKGSFYMGVDYESVLSVDGPGRESVRIESKKYYDEGLYIIDIQHMPGSICGTWPAFWSVGPNWPYDGEIDIIEGVNLHDANKIVLHTSGSCDVAGEYEMMGTLTSGECGDASGTIGCVVQGQKGSSGTPFNAQGGGVYVMEWTAEYIKIWYLPRSSIPTSITEGTPDTSTFGTPMAHLQGTCNFHERFSAQKFVLDTTFCGDWSGNVFGESGCPMSDTSSPMNSCVDFVAKNPAVFKQAYWEINSIKFFKAGKGVTNTQAPISIEISTTQSATETVPAVTLPNTDTTTVTAATTTTTTVTHETSSTTQVEQPETLTKTKATSVPTTVETTRSHHSTMTADVEPVSLVSVSKSTRYVTITTTICPLKNTATSTSRVVHITPVSSAESIISEATTVETSNSPAATSSDVDEEASPVCSTGTQSTTPHATTASDAQPTSMTSSGPSWVIIPWSSEIITLPTSAKSYSPPTTSASPTTSTSPTTTTTESALTTPTSPIFTGAGSKLSIGISGIVCAIAFAILA